jgi:NAD(P)H-hydrate epimerase
MGSSTSNKQTLVFSREALRAIDTDAVELYNIPSIVLMENAGRGAAEILVKTIAEPLLATIVVVCGSGNNGGDGYVVARHLSNNGCGVSILQVATPKTQDAITNATNCDSMGIQ